MQQKSAHVPNALPAGAYQVQPPRSGPIMCPDAALLFQSCAQHVSPSVAGQFPICSFRLIVAEGGLILRGPPPPAGARCHTSQSTGAKIGAGQRGRTGGGESNLSKRHQIIIAVPQRGCHSYLLVGGSIKRAHFSPARDGTRPTRSHQDAKASVFFPPASSLLL